MKTKKIFSIILFITICSSQAYSQKFIKYFFNDNHVRIIVEKSIVEVKEKEKINLVFQDNHPEKFFLTKNEKVSFTIFKRSGDNEKLSDEISSLDIDLNDGINKVLKSDFKIKVSKKEIRYFEYTNTNDYCLHFFAPFNESTYYEFIFNCPANKMEKWQEIAYYMMKSLEIK